MVFTKLMAIYSKVVETFHKTQSQSVKLTVVLEEKLEISEVMRVYHLGAMNFSSKFCVNLSRRYWAISQDNWKLLPAVGATGIRQGTNMYSQVMRQKGKKKDWWLSCCPVVIKKQETCNTSCRLCHKFFFPWKPIKKANAQAFIRSLQVKGLFS